MSRFQSNAAAMLLANNLWQVEFARRGDRLSHVISRVVDGRPAPILASIEGSHEEAWPPSPPLQEIHFESRPGVQLALPVGMAGKSHWSISIELSEATGKLTFDVACRLRGAPGFLGSRYQILAPSPGGGPASLAWTCHVEPVEEADSCGVVRDAATLEIVAQANSAEFPTTVRWRYVLSAG